MKFALLACLSILLQVAVTIPLGNIQEKIPATYDDQQDPYFWEKSGKFQGDIVLTPEQAKNLYSGNEQRNGVTNAKLLWPNRVVPYVISGDFNATQKSYIERSLKEDYARTCIRVVPRTDQADYVYVTGKDTGCWSHVGRLGGRQELNLHPNRCLSYSLIVHEFLHAAGFYHMQSATERDNFVTIQWKNIQSGKEDNFDKLGADVISSFGQPYDYDSVMHYDAFAFSKNFRRTIVPKKNVQLGTAEKLSSIDIAKLNRMYNC